jgi:hypothetical protein
VTRKASRLICSEQFTLKASDLPEPSLQDQKRACAEETKLFIHTQRVLIGVRGQPAMIKFPLPPDRSVNTFYPLP